MTQVRITPEPKGKSCPSGYTYRKGYTRTSASGKKTRVPPGCVPKTSVYPGSRKKWQANQLAEKKARHEKAEKHFKGKRKPKCADDEILIDSFYQPSSGNYVFAHCKKDTGAKGKTKITPVVLKKGRLTQYGYSILPRKLQLLWDLDYVPAALVARDLRRRALKNAIFTEAKGLKEATGKTLKEAKRDVAISVSRRLDILARYSQETNPAHHKLYRSDANWIRKQDFYQK